MADEIRSNGATLPRIGLLDSLRGAALLAMASYHLTWDLEFFGYLDPGTATEGFFRLYARGIASSFLFLVGISLVLAHGKGIRWPAFRRRFAMVLGSALAISLATYLATPEGWIFFGILHCIAVGSLIGLAFLRLPVAVTLVVAAAAIALPNLYRSSLFDPIWLAWIGLPLNPPRSNDFVPLLPWIGPILLGIAATRIAGTAGLLQPPARLPAGPALLRLAGRNSLVFYLLHQPLLIGLVYLATVIAPPQKPDPIIGYLRSCETSCAAQGETPASCSVFCACTLDKLLERELFTPLQSGAIQPGEDERILKLARECTAVSH